MRSNRHRSSSALVNIRGCRKSDPPAFRQLTNPGSTRGRAGSSLAHEARGVLDRPCSLVVSTFRPGTDGAGCENLCGQARHAPKEAVDLACSDAVGRRAALGPTIKLAKDVDVVGTVAANASYVTTTSFGSINANIAGSYILNRELTSVAGQTPIDDIAANNPRLNLSATLGATIGNFSANATLYHTAGYDVQNIPEQTRVDAFNVVDLFFSYDVGGEGVFEDLAFTLNVNNVFDQDPPFLNSDDGYTNGSTLGRLVQVGVRKKF